MGGSQGVTAEALIEPLPPRFLTVVRLLRGAPHHCESEPSTRANTEASTLEPIQDLDAPFLWQRCGHVSDDEFDRFIEQLHEQLELEYTCLIASIDEVRCLLDVDPLRETFDAFVVVCDNALARA